MKLNVFACSSAVALTGWLLASVELADAQLIDRIKAPNIAGDGIAFHCRPRALRGPRSSWGSFLLSK